MTEFAPVVILIEDEKPIRRFVRTALEMEGCHIFETETANGGLIEVGTRKPDLVILDLGLQDRDGVDFIKDLRNWSAVPILVLSARTEETDKVEALDAGADDYLTKPFGVGELLARLRALLRRRTFSHDTGSQIVEFGKVRMDLAKRVIKFGNQQVHLTPIEYRLLTSLIANAGKVLTHRYLLREVWGPTYIDHNHYLRVYMGHLRQKLEADPNQPRHLITETGVGYRFVF